MNGLTLIYVFLLNCEGGLDVRLVKTNNLHGSPCLVLVSLEGICIRSKKVSLCDWKMHSCS